MRLLDTLLERKPREPGGKIAGIETVAGTGRVARLTDPLERYDPLARMDRATAGLHHDLIRAHRGKSGHPVIARHSPGEDLVEIIG